MHLFGIAQILFMYFIYLFMFIFLFLKNKIFCNS